MYRELRVWAALLPMPVAGIAAQSPVFARIQGVVYTQIGRDGNRGERQPIEAASVRLLETAYRTWSSPDGHFAFDSLPPGVYLLEVRRLGFRPARQPVRLVAGQTAAVEAEMAPAPITVDAVVVEALVDQGRRTYELSALHKVPPVGTANVTTVTLSDIREVHARNPWDLVREATGLEVHEQGQGPGFASNAVIRGFTSDHSADVALVVDGVPVNEPINGHGEGYADWSLLFPGALADLQVVKGPASPLFGNFAAGGVVNATTQASTDRTTVMLEGGSHAYTSAGVTTGLEQGDWGGFFGVHGARSAGWRDHSKFATLQLLARGNRRLSPTLLVDAGAHYYGSEWDSPGYLSLRDFDAGALTQAADTTDGGTKARAQGRVSVVLASSSVRWHSLLWGYRSRWHLFLNIPELGGEGEGLGRQTEELDRRTAAGAQSVVRWTTGPFEVTGGVEAQLHEATYDIWVTNARRRDLTVNRFDSRLLTAGIMSGVAANLGRELRLEAALRVDHLTPASTDRVLRQALPAGSHTVMSPKFGAVWYARADLQLYGSAARGFRSAPSTIGDPTRPPVTVWAFECGGRYSSGPFEGSLAAFRLETTRERLFNPVTLAIDSDGRSIREGLEAELSVHAADVLTLHTHWSWNATGRFFRTDSASARAQSAGPEFHLAVASGAGAVMHDEPPGERVPAVADYSGRAGVTLRPRNGLSLITWVTVMGPYVPLGEPTAETDPYAIANVRASVRLSQAMELSGGLDNLLDARAAELRASGAVNPVAPRTAHLSLRTQF